MRQPLFGVSAAGFRLEGGFNGPGEPANQWGAWERTGKVPSAGLASPGVWAAPDRVLDLAASLGAEALALGVEWARVEPGPGRRDAAAVARYASILASAADRGLTPLAVLCDVATPGWLGEEFWLTPGSPDRFADHAAWLVEGLGPACRHWVTMRQPNLVAFAGWVDGRHPPRRLGAVADAWAVVDNLLAAHALAYEAIHDARPEADVLFGLRASPSYDWQRLLLDLLCAPALGVARENVDTWIEMRRARHDAMVTPGDLGELAWRRLAGATAPFGAGGKVVGRLRRPSPRRVLDVVYGAAGRRPRSARGPDGSNGSSPSPSAEPGYPLDGLLVVWCPPPLAPSRVPGSGARAPWQVRPDPGALGAWCRGQSLATPGLALWVEDGFATRDGVPRADGWDRRSYLRTGVAAAEEAGLAGYLYATLEGGGDPTWPDADFGLVSERSEGDAASSSGPAFPRARDGVPRPGP
ncbi:MAG TPA: family 1 glycosylhydrolase [Acidimicrobiales bacterium]|nr:family 1 glycosylhydrolase [Acidimicrobiales bacterium]